MALRPPMPLNNASGSERPGADEMRLLFDALGGSDTSADIAGVVGAGALKVTQHAGTPGMSVDIAAGHAFCESTEGNSDGVYHVYNDATVQLTVTAANATNPRKDFVIVEIRDSAEAGSDDDAHFVYVAGTASATPAEPDLQALGYDNYAILALVDVPANDTSITNSQITDRRTASSCWSRGRGEIGYDEVTASTGSAATTFAIVPGIQVDVTVAAGRILRLSTFWETHINYNTADTEGSVAIQNLAGNTKYAEGRFHTNSVGKNDMSVHASRRISSGGGGSFTFTVWIKTLAGTVGLYADSNTPGYLLVEDIGGILI